MASVHPRKSKAGEITCYQVKWRLGGGATAPWQTEKFDDDTSATIFKEAVNEAGQQWPPGWVKGVGYITADTSSEEAADAAYRFRAWALDCVEHRTGIEEHTRKAYRQELESWVFPTFGECDVRSAEHFSKRTVAAWVIRLENTVLQNPRRKMSPKTVRNVHGLLSSILKEAIGHEPPLRVQNPCAATNLPDASDEIEDEMEFLTPDEVTLLLGHFTYAKDRRFAIVKYGTGLRYGEITALQPQDIIDPYGRRPKLRVQRAWKKDGHGGYYLGKPKSKKGRRTIRISPTVVAALVEQGLGTLAEDELLWTGTERNQRMHYSTFGDRWVTAVKRARAAGLTKRPTPHDLRHSHASALIAAGQPLPYIQRRLGHESIQTTSDRYGHLLPELDDDAMTAIETSLAGERPALRSVS
jgi:integrase